MQDYPPIKIFIVYAREDAEALRELRVQFIPVARSERLEVWYDGEILPGQHWDQEIKAHLQSADIILLFISKYFFASEYIQTIELEKALARYDAGKSVVIPVIVRPCVWQDAFEVSQFQVLPTGARAIFSSAWRDQDEAMVSVVEGVRKVVYSIRNSHDIANDFVPITGVAPNFEDEADILRSQKLKCEDQYWKRIRKLDVKEIYEKFIKENPQHSRVHDAAKRIRWKERTIIVYLLLSTFFMALVFFMMKYPDFFGVKLNNQKNINFNYPMVSVKGGTYTMGSPESELYREKDECQHSVTVGTFSIGKYEVSQTQWRGIMGNNPSLSPKDCDDCPVDFISYNDIQEFLKKLNANTSQHYRLPTEEEWEYAARGGNKSNGYKYSGSNNVNEVAWYPKTSNDKLTNPVGSKKPNEFGIYDMSGNAWEWCSTPWKAYPGCTASECKECIVLRGGSWDKSGDGCRIADRIRSNPSYKESEYGLRLAKDEE